MFTGLVEATGKIAARTPLSPGLRLVIDCPAVAEDARIGDSIAVSGCCLTVVQRTDQGMHFDLGEETLQRTRLGQLHVGDRVNLERSLKAGDPLGGHLVTAHVDGLGTLVAREDHGDWSTFRIQAPRPLMLQMASKGSITVDGVSLTLVDVDDDQFSVALIPHTLSITTLGELTVGQQVHLETDILAKYVQRTLEGMRDEGRETSKKGLGLGD